jgi:probable HAF family extracellular repeat protein
MSLKVKSHSGPRSLGEKSRAFLSAAVLLTALGCTSEESLTAPFVAAGVTPEMRVAATYTVVDLGTLGAEFGCCSEAFGINPQGQVVGEATTASEETHAFLWEKGVMTDLGTLGGASSRAFDINPAGQVVGTSTIVPGQDFCSLFICRSHAFLWEEGAMVDLGTLGGNFSEANGINPAGQVVGGSETEDGQQHAFLWEKGVMTDLGTLGGCCSEAWDISPAGQVVGGSHTAGGQQHAFLWEKGVMTDLGPGLASGINPKGQVVIGNRLWDRGVITDLGSLGGHEAGSAIGRGINPAGQVVGGVVPADRVVAFIWEKGIITELKPGGLTSMAFAINPAGQVVGTREVVIDEPHATLWTRK